MVPQVFVRNRAGQAAHRAAAPIAKKSVANLGCGYNPFRKVFLE
ncbi:MAG: hypothetical protein QOI83_448, partial [Streptomycetaceae bacterium]|nr:hypothetical protein [Streptomycetaceae bacterium]